MLIKDIAQLLLTEIKQRSTLVLAIDGRCAAGKTTLAARLAELCDCNVIHMDHFFLCSKQNTMERLQQAGGNMDYVRFIGFSGCRSHKTNTTYSPEKR